MNNFFKTLCLAGSVSLLTTQIEAQQTTTTTETKSDKEIIIRKKTDADAKVTIEINGDQIKVNGKPISEFDDKNLDVDVENIRIRAIPRKITSGSPFRGGTLSFDRNEPLVVTGYGTNLNRAQLGVVTERGDDGVKVKTVSKGSAAEKAGIKEGDVISKINDAKIESPDDLSKAVAKYKPEDKVDVRVKRGKKEEKLTATLGKTSTLARTYTQNMEFNSNGNNMLFGQPDRIVIGSATPKLGLYAQDTEDGKGVKVLGVDEGSIAQKSGLKEGDLITEFDGKAVNDATELMQASRTAKDKNNMKVKVIRDGKTQDLEIKIPKKLKTANL
jgi:serine protease Do